MESHDEAYALRCMEIVGGNAAYDNSFSVAGMDAFVFSAPYEGHATGGDIHYISTCGHGRIVRFAVADVSGHGSDVAELSHRLRALMRKHINTLNQTRFLKSLNNEFARLAESGKFATAVLTSYFAPTDEIVICNAGHPPPLFYRAAGREWRLLTDEAPGPDQSAANLPLGIIDGTNYCQFSIKLEPHDVIVLYSDSLIEAHNDDDRLLEPAGLLRLARGLDPTEPHQFQRDLLAAVRSFGGGGALNDDVTLIVLYHNASDPPRMSWGEYFTVVGKALGLVPV